MYTLTSPIPSYTGTIFIIIGFAFIGIKYYFIQKTKKSIHIKPPILINKDLESLKVEKYKDEIKHINIKEFNEMDEEFLQSLLASLRNLMIVG